MRTEWGVKRINGDSILPCLDESQADYYVNQYAGMGNYSYVKVSRTVSDWV